MVVKKAFQYSIFLLSIVFFSCRQATGIRKILNRSGNTGSLINKAYFRDVPLAEIINLPQMTDSSISFAIKEDSRVQIYATGELNINLADVPRAYFFKSDDMELFFKDKAGLGEPGLLHSLTLTWQNGILQPDTLQPFIKNVQYVGNYDNSTRKYRALIQIPWSVLTKTPPATGIELPFDIAIADNDDNMKQKAKITWNSKTDPLLFAPSPGAIRLTRTPGKQEPGVIYCTYKTDTAQWESFPAYAIKNIVAGEVKDTEDLSASIRSWWNKETLRIGIEVYDSRKSYTQPANMSNAGTFHDYGWIENSSGLKIWTMHALYSKYAGGAVKNQQIDTVITLPKGKYMLRYITDESHNWNSWDDAPPATPFYGIVLYKQHP